jgi:hypothetical protein
MTLWDKNIAFFHKHFPDFYRKATSREYACSNLKVKEAEVGNLFIDRGETRCFLHSKYYIEREMRELLGENNSPDQILIIFGLGMGYCLDYIQKHQIDYRQILIIEPYNNIFKEMLKFRDFKELMNKRAVSLSIFKEAREIMPVIVGQVMTSRSVKFLYHVSYRSIFDELFQEISRLFINEKRSFLGSTATVDFFIHEWSENQLLSIAKEYPSAMIFNDRFKDIPAVIVAAGPSLDKRLDELKSIGDRALIIAPGTGAKICNKNNIGAHMGIAMDSQKAEADLFKNSKIEVLIGSYRLHPDVSRVFPNHFYRMVISNEFIAQYFCEYFNLSFDIINDHASISSSAIDFAVKLGCNPIILIGQDMCYYDNKGHAGDTKDTIPQKVRNGLIEHIDINGELVLTHPSFLSIQRDMENLNLKYKDNYKIINASEAGLGIPGIENCKFKDIINTYISTRKDDVRQIIETALRDSETLNSYQNIDIEDFYRHIADEINKLEEMNEKKLQALRVLAETIEKNGSNKLRIKKKQAIETINKEMEQNAFYMRVVGRMLNHFLLFFKAGALYEFNDNPDNSEAFLYYEMNLYRLTYRYMDKIKEFVTRLLVSKDYNKQYEGANFTVTIDMDELNSNHSLVIPFDISDNNI